MKIGIVGAGFTGLAAGYRLARRGHDVVIFEKDTKPGGLAVGFKRNGWTWTLEKFYHHVFTNDEHFLKLADEVGHEMVVKTPLTSTFIKESIYQLDSPVSLLKFPHLSVTDRIRTGLVLAYLKYFTGWEYLESQTAKNFIKRTMGSKSWQTIWEPLFIGKFGKYSADISASWYWARIKKRTRSLGYPKGGFLQFADNIASQIVKYKGKIYYNKSIDSIGRQKNGLKIIADGREYKFDKVICTLPSYLFLKITKGLHKEYRESIGKLKGLAAINLVLGVDRQFLNDGTYWLNINDRSFPFIAVVEHTNFMDKAFYNNGHILYIGDYLEVSDNVYKKGLGDILELYLPYLKKINKSFSKEWIIHKDLFKVPFAQPIVDKSHSKHLPPHKTPIKGLFLANIQQVYPWDRGVNYAIEIGNRVSDMVLEKDEK